MNTPTQSAPVLDLPVYRCERQVNAARIVGIAPACQTTGNTEITLEIPGKQPVTQVVNTEWVRKNNPTIGGHYVRLQNGEECFVSHNEFQSIYHGV